MPEGGSATWTVALEAQPTAKVVVDVRSDNADVTVYPSVLDFSPTDWDMPRTVTVTAAEDGDSLDDVAALTHAVRDAESAGEYADVTAGLDVTVADNDVRELVLGKLAPVPEGGATAYTARFSRPAERGRDRRNRERQPRRGGRARFAHVHAVELEPGADRDRLRRPGRRHRGRRRPPSPTASSTPRARPSIARSPTPRAR